MKDVSHRFPLRDGRTTADGDVLGRDVIYELGIPEPYVMATDSYVRTPLRVSHNGAAGFVLEVGDLDFSDSDFDALENAVKEMRRIINSSRQGTKANTYPLKRHL